MSDPSQGRHRAPATTDERIGGALVGTVVSFENGEVRVKVPGVESPAVARALAVFDDATLRLAAKQRGEVVLLFEGGDPARPLLVGLLRSRTPLVDELLTHPLPESQKIARLDAKRVVLEGKEEVVLRCGKASLTLQRDGRVVLRGVSIMSQADQVHKIRGGKVQVN